jgi:hypothetical protein
VILDFVVLFQILGVSGFRRDLYEQLSVQCLQSGLRGFFLDAVLGKIPGTIHGRVPLSLVEEIAI